MPMSDAQRYAQLAASALEIIGGFLLAVEAVKLQNLTSLRERFLEPMRKGLTPRVLVPRKASKDEIVKRVEQAQFRFLNILAGIAFVLLAGVLVYLTGSPYPLWAFVRGLLPESWWLAAPLLLGLAFPLYVICLFAGFLMYSLVLLPFRACIRTLTLIEAHTASGVIGILGFLLFAVGAIWQTWMQFTSTAP